MHAYIVTHMLTVTHRWRNITSYCVHKNLYISASDLCVYSNVQWLLCAFEH